MPYGKSASAEADLLQQVRDLSSENQLLRRQLYSSVSLLDAAVSQLGTLGYALETPTDIRAIRSQMQAPSEAQISAPRFKNPLEDSQTAASTAGPVSKKLNLFKTLQHHSKAVHCCAFSPGGTEVLASGGLDRQLVLQNFTKSETKLWSVAAHKECISDITWLTEDHVITGSFDCSAKLWDCSRDDASAVYHYHAEGLVLSTAALDRNSFAVADTRNVRVMDTRSDQPVMTRDSAWRVNSIAYDSSSRFLFMGQNDGAVTVWDMRRSGTALLPNNASIYASPSLPSTEDGLSTSTSTVIRPTSSLAGKLDATSAAAVPTRKIWSEHNGAAVNFVAHVHSDDDTKRLISVSNDNVVRLFSGSLGAPTSSQDLYTMNTLVAPANPSNGYTTRAAFWKGVQRRATDSALYDDGEKDTQPRRLTECDLLITGGSSNRALVYDVTDPGNPSMVEALSGHRDRVTAAVVHHTKENLIIATSSADGSVCIWLPSKS